MAQVRVDRDGYVVVHGRTVNLGTAYAGAVVTVRPNKSAPKQQWVEYAVERGAEPSTAQQATKDALMDQLDS